MSIVLVGMEVAGAAQGPDRLARFSGGSAYRALPTTDQRLVDRLLPVLGATAAACRDPEATLRCSLDLLERLVARPPALAALARDPRAIERMVTLVGASPWLGRLLLDHPELVEDLLPGAARERFPSLDVLRAELEVMLAGCDDEEACQLALRQFKHRRVVHVLALDLDGGATLDEVSGALSDLADLLLEAVLLQVTERLGLRTLAPVGIIGYGKLGAREMSYASDTDVVFVYDQDKGVPESQLTRLAHTVNHWLTAPIAAGVLYQTDFRQRPHGDSGRLVNSIAALREYQAGPAGVRQHQALARARWVAGEPRLGRAFEDLRRRVLGQRRDAARLRTELIAERERILAEHGGAGAGFDVKHSRGGIIDVEFIVQHAVLRHAADHPALAASADNVGLLERAAGLGLLPAALTAHVAAAYRQYRLWLHADRLRGTESVQVSRSDAAPHRAAVEALWSALLDGESPR